MTTVCCDYCCGSESDHERGCPVHPRPLFDPDMLKRSIDPRLPADCVGLLRNGVFEVWRLDLENETMINTGIVLPPKDN